MKYHTILGLTEMGPRQKGFTVIEGLLLLVVAGIVGFTGWYVWSTKQKADKAYDNPAPSLNIKKKPVLTNKDCSLTSGEKGKILYEADRKTSFCAPDGWAFAYVGDVGDFLVDGRSYEQGKEPTLDLNRPGTDGPFELTIWNITQNDVSQIKKDYNFLKTTKTISELTVSNYYHLTGVNDLVGAGASYEEQGTKQYVFLVNDKDKIIQVQYNQRPSLSNIHDTVQGLVNSIQ